jgi:hypothetical protein
MLSFIRKLFGSMDRGEAASERVAVALEGLAEDVERVRAALRERLGVAELSAASPALPALPALPAPVVEIPAVAVPAEEPAKRSRKTHAA